MTPKQKIFVNMVVVLLLAVVMVAWTLIRLLGGGILTNPLVVTADFAGSGGVFTNQEVAYRGVLIGKVGKMSLNEDGVDIELIIEPEWKGKLPADVVAKIGSKSAVGEQFVNLIPTDDGTEKLRDGDVIAREATELPVDFQELLRSLDAVLADVPPDKARRLIENLAAGLEGRSEDIGTVLRSLGTLSAGFASVAEEQRRLLDNATQVGTEFLRTKDAFARAIRAADDVFAGIGDEPEELRGFLAENDRLAREGIDLLNRRGRELREGIDALADFTTFQLRERRSVEQTLTHVPQFLGAVEEAAIPWRSPDGRTFYRIRVGLVVDQLDESSWPCKYERDSVYHREYFVRKEKRLNTSTRCVDLDEAAAQRALLSTLQRWVEEAETSVDLSFGSTGYTATDISFAWPLNGPITSGFGPRDGRLHAGIDIDGNEGELVTASAPGRVVTSGYHSGGYGNVVVIDHGDGFTTLYAHLSEIALRAGDVVEGGDLVGLVGCTGRCTGDHLHFEIRIDGLPTDPLPYLPGGVLVPVGTTSDTTEDPNKNENPDKDEDPNTSDDSDKDEDPNTTEDPGSAWGPGSTWGSGTQEESP